ncbi:hypothetical protein GF412_04970 [Candidatus Micrarchaeota archaeon]|nr:hypothetical protein [Candidatus Micrarchaeota archaeon]MBD3418305.1 hypothetical protein [Candidatus Micrarchaeota archaeon]
MKKTFEGHLFNRIVMLGNRKYSHVGCESNNSKSMDFLSRFVPEVGMRRRVRFVVESDEEPTVVEEYKSGYVAKEDEY